MLKGETLFVVVGKSGSGKTTLCKLLEHRIGAKQVKSYTTRPKRSEDENDHIFIESFSEWTRQAIDVKIAALSHFDGYNYWTTEDQIEDANLVVLDVDGANCLKSHYAGNKTLKVIYIDCPVIDRYFHMCERGMWSAIKRIIHDHYKFRRARAMADYVVENHDLEEEEAYKDMVTYILQEDWIR